VVIVAARRGQALKRLKAVLPRESILVGQNIAKDVEWLALRENEDFAAMLDLAALLRVWNGTCA
jgi:hypothetical protein